MHIPWAMLLIISLRIRTGFPSSNSDITIGVMVALQHGVKSLPEIVDNVTTAYSRFFQEHGHLEVKWALLNSTNITDISRTVVCEMIHQGVQAVITVPGFTQRRMVSGITETSRIPHLSVDLDLSSLGECIFTLHLTSQYKTLSRALVDIARAADWKQIHLNFNKILDYRTRQQFVLELSLAGIRTVLSQSTHPNITDWGIVLMVESGRVNPTQNEDTTHLMLTKVVFVNDLTGETLRRLQRTNKHINILAVQIYSTPTYTLCNTSSNEDITACDAGEWNICHQLNKPVEYNLYFIPVGSDRDPIPLGQWTENTGLSITTTHPDITNRLFPHKLNDFGGITLRVLVDGSYRPFSFPSGPGDGSYVGMVIDIMDDLADKLNFRYTVSEAPGNQFGAKGPDGNFTGMVGMVARGEADIGAATFTVTTERSEVVDFTTGFLQDSLGILTPKVTKTRNLFQVFKPFTLETWLTILAVCLCACVVFVFISLKSLRKTTDIPNQHAMLERSVWDNVLLIISTYFEQGPTFHPATGSSRCFLSFWMIFTLLAIATYTANLAAVLTVTTPVKPIDTLQDLADRTEFGILLDEGSSIWSLFNRSEQPLYMEIASRMETPDITVDPTDVVREGQYCYIIDRSYLEFVVAQSCGELRLASERFHGSTLAFIITKNSPYKAAIDFGLQKMIESGLILTLLEKWMRPRTDCPTADLTEIPQLGLDALGGVFIIYLAAISASIITLFIQLLYNHYCRKCTN